MKHIGSTRQLQSPTLDNHGQWKDIITIIKECKKSNIQVELYKNVSKFRSHVGPGDVSLSELSDVIKNLYNIRKGTDTKLYRGGVTTADRENFRNTNLHKAKSQHPWYIILMKLYESDVNDIIPTDYIDYIARHGWNGRDQIYSAQADIHNMRSNLPRHLKRFLIILKKSKLSLADFYKSLYEKWKPKFNY